MTLRQVGVKNIITKLSHTLSLNLNIFYYPSPLRIIKLLETPQIHALPRNNALKSSQSPVMVNESIAMTYENPLAFFPASAMRKSQSTQHNQSTMTIYASTGRFCGRPPCLRLFWLLLLLLFPPFSPDSFLLEEDSGPMVKAAVARRLERSIWVRMVLAR